MQLSGKMKNEKAIGILAAVTVAVLITAFVFITIPVKKQDYPQAPPEGYGDVDEDGYVSWTGGNKIFTDVWYVYNFFADHINADVNNDGIVDTSDINEVLDAWQVNPGDPYIEKYDLNFDGVVNEDDVAIVTFMNGKDVVSAPQTAERIYKMNLSISLNEFIRRADVSGDGVVDINDVELIEKYAKREITSFPVQGGTNHPPIADFTYKTNSHYLLLDASSSYDPDGDITYYNWTILVWTAGSGLQTFYRSGKIVNFTLIDDSWWERYEITLKVKDSWGATATKTIILDSHSVSINTHYRSGSGIVVASPEPLYGKYLHGTIVTLTAIPYGDSVFIGWGVTQIYYPSGESEYYSTTDNPLIINVTSDYEIDAVFASSLVYNVTIFAKDYDATITILPPGGSNTTLTIYGGNTIQTRLLNWTRVCVKQERRDFFYTYKYTVNVIPEYSIIGNCVVIIHDTTITIEGEKYIRWGSVALVAGGGIALLAVGIVVYKKLYYKHI